MSPDTPLPADAPSNIPSEPSIDGAGDAPGDAVAAATTAAAPAPAAAEMSPSACGQQLKKLFPALFAGAPKPLKLRIQADIQERAPGVFTKQVLSAFLRRHTGATSYLIAVSKASHRFDLDGAPAGELLDEHRKVALDELSRRRGLQDERRELEEQQRRNRANLLRSFETTTLTRPNFCALMGVAAEELDGLLAQARQEADERAQQRPAFGQDRHTRPPQGRRDGRGGPGRSDGPRDGRAGGRPDHRRDARGPRRGPAQGGPRPGAGPRPAEASAQNVDAPAVPVQDPPSDNPKPPSE